MVENMKMWENEWQPNQKLEALFIPMKMITAPATIMCKWWLDTNKTALLKQPYKSHDHRLRFFIFLPQYNIHSHQL